MHSFSFKDSPYFQNYLGQITFFSHISFKKVALHICNMARLFCHILYFILGSLNLLNEFFKFACSKIHSLCFKVLWVSTNAWCYESTTRAAYRMVFTTPQIPSSSSTQRLSPLPMQSRSFYSLYTLASSRIHVIGVLQYLAFSDWLL